MSRPGPGTAPLSRHSSRPVGLAHGAPALVAAWLAGGTIAILTGATAVMILLAIGVVAMVAGVLSGWAALRHADVHALTTAGLAVSGDDLHWQVHARTRAPLHVQLRPVRDGAPTPHDALAAGWVGDGTSTINGTAPARGVYREVQVTWSSGGGIGLVWWRRRALLSIRPLAVAPVAALDPAPADRLNDDAEGEYAAHSLPGRDEVDGVRNWRDGDELSGVHWPSTLRTGEFVVRQRFREQDERWVVHARTRTADPTTVAAQVRHSLEAGLQAGAKVAVSVDGGEPLALADRDAVLHWCAGFDPTDPPAPRTPWWRRAILVSPEPDRHLTAVARWMLAASVAVPMLMVLEPLGYGPSQMALVLVGTFLGAALSGAGWRLRPTIRQLAALAVGVGIGATLIDVAAIDSLVASLRYLLPQVLVALITMQGFECIDRRGARVSLACAAILTAYAAGIRVDARLSGWLFASVVMMALASRLITRQERAVVDWHWRASLRRTASLVVAVACVFGILAVVPVPRGPAQLTLPSWLEEVRPTSGDGQLAAPDGSPLLGGQGGTRGGTTTSSGASGGYPGFSPTMDTALRGDLGDEVVLRVRSPEPDYWRGQTYTRFDGRTWYVNDNAAAGDTGFRTDGPDHRIRPADGDLRDGDTAGGDELIQTFYAEVDLPNIVFAAYRPSRVLLNAPLWQRPDGALRADVTLTAGSAYTVVSHRTGATAESLRADGDLSVLGYPDEYLQLPDSITARTIALARQLAAGTTNTYDMIQTIEAWLAANVAYDLNAPVPGPGKDAVDEFLFESQRGFCEQIATATAVLLRALGVPARVATGYVPGERDEVAGVWISRASDAHAWVEVPFPSSGWVAFDPTASVPLSGESSQNTIGAELLRAIGDVAAGNAALVLGLAFGGMALLTLARLVRRWWRRHRRGRWGVLQDRFAAAALRRGAPTTAANAALAEAFVDIDAQAAALAAALAAELDASAFSITWIDDDARYEQARDTVRHLEHVGAD